MSILGKIVGQLESGGSSGQIKTLVISDDSHPINPGYIICGPLEHGAYCKGVMYADSAVSFEFVVSKYRADSENLKIVGWLSHDLLLKDSKVPYPNSVNFSTVEITIDGTKYLALKMELDITSSDIFIHILDSSHPDVLKVLTSTEIASITNESSIVFEDSIGKLFTRAQSIITRIEGDISTLQSAKTSLESRVSALESAGSG